MGGLAMFTMLAGAGCSFLIYFMFALWRDSRTSRTGPRVEVTKLPGKPSKGNLLHLYSSNELHPRGKKTV